MGGQVSVLVIIQIACLSFLVLTLPVICSYLHATTLYNRSTERYYAGDIAGGDALKRRAARWGWPDRLIPRRWRKDA